MIIKKNCDGFVLPVVVSCLLVVGVIVGATINYIISGARMAGVHMAASRCRLSAQTALDISKADIYDSFRQYYRLNPTMWNVLYWFDTYTDESVGLSGHECALMQGAEVNGCTVSVTLTGLERSPSGLIEQFARLTLRVTASCRSASGVEVARSIEESVEYAMRRSEVFDYAYFVNNYGWFMGGGVTANGDIRANGNMYLDGLSWVNGLAFAAANEMLGAAGTISGSARSKSLEEYWAENNIRARPTSPTSEDGMVWAMGYDGYSELRPYHDPIEMPYLKDMELYREIAYASESTIKQQGKVLVDGCYSGVGPSGIPNGPDMGCIVLDGTSKPIEINGPVVVDGDVVIKGTVKGQGTIYAGRNIYIVGDLRYDKPPEWPKPDDKPEQTSKKNEAKDMLGLAAKGNIILGNYTDSSWMSAVKDYIKPPFVKAYECDPSDASIGYGAVFPGDYTAKDSGKKVNYTYNNKTKQWEPAGESDRRYYESSMGDHVVKNNAQSSAITRIDAVLYNNHATMGRIGQCLINGALICRDEGIIYSSSIKFNWDIRLGSRSPEGINFFICLPLSPTRPRVISWQEVQI